MKEQFKAFYDSLNRFTASKTLSESAGSITSNHINNSNLENSDGNAFIGAKVSEASFTISVTCALFFGEDVGYGPYHDLLDESSTRVKTFDSTKVFQASLYNQSWFNRNHQGFKLTFTMDSGSGDCTIVCEGTVS